MDASEEESDYSSDSEDATSLNSDTDCSGYEEIDVEDDTVIHYKDDSNRCSPSKTKQGEQPYCGEARESSSRNKCARNAEKEIEIKDGLDADKNSLPLKQSALCRTNKNSNQTSRVEILEDGSKGKQHLSLMLKRISTSLNSSASNSSRQKNKHRKTDRRKKCVNDFEIVTDSDTDSDEICVSKKSDIEYHLSANSVKTRLQQASSQNHTPSAINQRVGFSGKKRVGTKLLCSVTKNVTRKKMFNDIEKRVTRSRFKLKIHEHIDLKSCGTASNKSKVTKSSIQRTKQHLTKNSLPKTSKIGQNDHKRVKDKTDQNSPNKHGKVVNNNLANVTFIPTHSKGKAGTYTCQTCTMSFRNMYSLAKHMRTHAAVNCGFKPYTGAKSVSFCESNEVDNSDDSETEIATVEYTNLTHADDTGKDKTDVHEGLVESEETDFPDQNSDSIDNIKKSKENLVEIGCSVQSGLLVKNIENSKCIRKQSPVKGLENDTSEESDIVETDNVEFLCGLCQAVFSTPELLKQHMWQHIIDPNAAKKPSDDRDVSQSRQMSQQSVNKKDVTDGTTANSQDIVDLTVQSLKSSPGKQQSISALDKQNCASFSNVSSVVESRYADSSPGQKMAMTVTKSGQPSKEKLSKNNCVTNTASCSNHTMEIEIVETSEKERLKNAAEDQDVIVIDDEPEDTCANQQKRALKVKTNLKKLLKYKPKLQFL